MSAVGAGVMIAVNVIFVPRIGYWACAWGGFAGYGTAMLLSWIIGSKKFPVPYDTGTIILFMLLAALVFVLVQLPDWAGLQVGNVLRIAYGTVLLAVYAFLVLKEIKKNSKKSLQV